MLTGGSCLTEVHVRAGWPVVPSQQDQLIEAPVLQPPVQRPSLPPSQSNIVKMFQTSTKTGATMSGVFAGANTYGGEINITFVPPNLQENITDSQPSALSGPFSQ